MAITSRGKGHQRSALVVAASVALALLLSAQSTRAQTNVTLSETCGAVTAELDASQDFTNVFDNYWEDNGLCFSALLFLGDSVSCTTSQSVYNDECKGLDRAINDRPLEFCKMTLDGTTRNTTFPNSGEQTWQLEYYTCVYSDCTNSQDMAAFVEAFLPEELLDGSKNIDFQCTAFFDPVQAFWDEYMIWIIVGIVVLVLIFFFCFCCLWWRRREAEKDKAVVDPTMLYGPNMAYATQQPPMPQQTEYDDETTDSEEVSSSEEDLTDDGLETDGSTYDVEDSQIEMSRTEHHQITTDQAMAQAGHY